MCTWGSRTRYSWLCIGCVAGRAGVDDDIRPVHRAGPAHVEEARAAVASAASAPAVAPQGPGDAGAEATGQGSLPVMHPSWDEQSVPNKGWWQSLSWDTALRTGVSTFVQVPDRFRGAVAHARHKALEVLEAACLQGEATAEWKLVLLFDLVLLARPRGEGPTCAELLEERLALWWGGQWPLLWASAVGGGPAPRTPSRKSTNRERARRVHTLAAAGEEARALAATVGAELAPRTEATLEKLRACFPAEAPRPEAPQPGARPGPPSAELREQVEQEAFKLLRRPPRLTAPGLLGARLEHLAASADSGATLGLLAAPLRGLLLESPPRRPCKLCGRGSWWRLPMASGRSGLSWWAPRCAASAFARWPGRGRRSSATQLASTSTEWAAREALPCW